MTDNDLEKGVKEKRTEPQIGAHENIDHNADSIHAPFAPISTTTPEDIIPVERNLNAGQPITGAEGLGRRQSHESEAPYSIFTHAQKISIVLAVSFMGIISPLSGSAYLPALPQISADLHVSNDLINITVTTYLVCTLSSSRLQEPNKLDSDIPGHRAVLYWQLLRYLRPKACLRDLLRAVSRS